MCFYCCTERVLQDLCQNVFHMNRYISIANISPIRKPSVDEEEKTYVNVASTWPSKTNCGASPRVPSQSSCTNDPHIFNISAGEQTGSTTPMVGAAFSPSSRNIRVREICCSAINRMAIRLLIAPSKNAAVSIGFMYFAHSWKLEHRERMTWLEMKSNRRLALWCIYVWYLNLWTYPRDSTGTSFA